MNLIEFIKTIEKIDEQSILYLKRINGQFTFESKITVLKILEEDEEMKSKDLEVTEKGFDYFLEVFLINEIIEDLEKNESVESKCKRLIHYAEFDC
ncbi:MULTISPECIES: hypothetical protein [unclassified Polaribacter]|uniref:hypothetical protein n=1 Tax=unclassified Polaribacter TaxID=196858 RepID=UPI0011BF798B|nr:MULTISPECIES: hypothetical protein [unclassified Polaribacter]TXD47386.1 hypothetical protein ES043_18240 [Polaribacter sp. IC063]TXD55733.1 hypothetical protein ES044_17720 [Polaribacter sp. IC066]